jgi:sugar phosphate isomerase/epimerase
MLMQNSESTVAGGTAWTRRIMIKTAGLGTLAWALPDGLLKEAAAADIPIGVQLYSVRGDCQKDFDAALEQVAGMGFAGVEFAGYYNYAGKPVELKKRLDELNLRAAGTHISTGLFRDDAIQSTVDFHQAIGCRFLIVPGDPAFTDPEKSKTLADVFNKTAALLKPLGMACGFHNHTAEFTKDGDKTYWDLFAERTSGDVILQQDCGWTAAAGYNPVEYVKKYPGRTRSVHFKPTVINIEKETKEKKAILGQDSVDWAAIFEACSSVGGTDWIIVEQETYPDGRSAMECTAQSLAGLKKLIGRR